jgi:spore coat polysaccharide biosynthesis predicted glycosyltransferase SpsG/RimJ/RimL family protein N-acetyltransferase
MNFFFRFDYNDIIGSGHLLRIKNLIVKILHNYQKKKIYIICRATLSERKQIRHHFKNLDIRIFFLSVKLKISRNNYKTWLRASEKNDAIQTAEICNHCSKSKKDLIFIDHYGITNRWLSFFSSKIKTILVDDYIRDKPNFNFVINGNSQIYKHFYKKKLSNLLSGFDFALYNPKYTPNYNKNLNKINIVIFFSNSDLSNFGYKILNLIYKFKNISITLISGTNSPIYKDKKKFKKYKNIKIIKFANNFEKIVKNTTLFIGSCGSTYINRIYYNIPSIVFSLSKNQEIFCNFIKDNKLGIYLGSELKFNKEVFLNNFNNLIKNKKKLKKMSNNCKGRIDSYSINRILEAINPSNSNVAKLKPLLKKHKDILYKWANDQDVVISSLRNKKITYIQHEKWFNNIYISKNVKIYLMYLKNLPIGQIRFDIFKKKILVDYSIDRFIRGKGYGNLIVKLGMKKIEKYKSTKIIEAVVKKSNLKSKKIFENLGFAKKVINNKVFKYTSV